MYNLLLCHNLSLHLICLFYKQHFKGSSAFSLWSSLKRHSQRWACKHPLVAMNSCSCIRKDLPKQFQFLSSNFCKFVLLVFPWASRLWNCTRPKPCKERAQEEVCPSVANLPLGEKKKVYFFKRKSTLSRKKTIRVKALPCRGPVLTKQSGCIPFLGHQRWGTAWTLHTTLRNTTHKSTSLFPHPLI